MARRQRLHLEALEDRLVLSGNGLTGTYYSTMNLTGPSIQRVDPTVNFDWGEGAPAAGVPADRFSVRWTGQIEARYSESYTFFTTSDDGVALFVNGQQVINHWNDHAPTVDAGTITLQAGQKVDIEMQFYENSIGATAKLEWQSAHQAREIVPQSQLYATVAAPPGAGGGDGLKATYFDHMDLTGTTVTRTDPTVQFQWGYGSPDSKIPTDTFSARWTGQILPEFSETYTFSTTSDDGVRLWVDGKLIIDQWNAHAPRVDSGSIALIAGKKYDIKLEYYEDHYGAEIKLEWQSASQARQVVPQARLFSGVTAPAIAIDAGGPAAGNYAADSSVSGGYTYTTGDSIDVSQVSNPAPQAVYQSERYGNFTYDVGNLTAGASYEVRLDFAEIYWNAAGQRSFNVLINGQQVLSNFDVFAAAGGKNRAIARTFTAVADAGGAIHVQFVTLKDNAKLSGITIAPLTGAPPAPPATPTNLAATAGNGQVSLTWSAVTGATSYNLYRGTSAGGEGTTALQVGVSGTAFTDSTTANGTTYFYVVSAVGAGGVGTRSNEASATPTAPPVSTGTVYYVSMTGSDANDGKSASSAWRTVAKVNATTFQAGDSILFQRGGEWRESLRASTSGAADKPITFGAYGNGARPVFAGSDIINNAAFQSLGGNLYRVDAPARVASVLVNNNFLLMANDRDVVQNQAGTWFWDASGLYVNTGGPDPRSDGRQYEACVRVDAVFSNGKDHLVFRDLTAEETADVNDGYCFRVMGSDDVVIEDCDAYRGGRHLFGVINSGHFLGENLFATYAMPNIPGGSTFYVSFSDASRNQDTHQWINCSGDHFENPGQGNYQIFYNHGDGNGLGAILIENMVSNGGKFSIGASSAQAPVTVRGGSVVNNSLEVFGNNVLVDGMTFRGSAALDVFGSDGLYQNSQFVNLNPVNGGPTGYSSAIVVRGGAMRNVFRFNTVVMASTAPGWGAALSLTGKGTQTSWYGNIFAANGEAVKNWAGSFDSSDVKFADYNLYKPQAKFTDASGQGPDFAGWQAKGFDLHSLSADPLFTNLAGGDLSVLAGSPAINGAAGLGPAFRPIYDTAGRARDDGAPDLGAYERR